MCGSSDALTRSLGSTLGEVQGPDGCCNDLHCRTYGNQHQGRSTYPLDTVGRRLQMRSERPVEEHIPKGAKHCFMKIAAAEGLATGLYKGFVANIIRSIGGALLLVLYDRGDVPWSRNTVWKMMIVRPIAEDWSRRGHASEFSEPQPLTELARSKQRLNSRRSRLLQCSAALSKEKAQHGVGKGKHDAHPAMLHSARVEAPPRCKEWYKVKLSSP